MDARSAAARIRPYAESDEALRIRSAVRFQTLGEKVLLVGLGIALPGFLVGSITLSLLIEGFDPNEWSAWLTVALTALVLIVAAIGDVVPRALTLDDRAIELRDLWKVKRIPLASVTRVYTAIDGRRLVVTVESASGVAITADAFDEDAKRRLLDRLQLLPGVPILNLRPDTFWERTLVRHPAPSPEMRPRWTSLGAASVGLALGACALAAIAIVTAAKGYPEVAVVLAILFPGLALMIWGGTLRNERVLDAGLIPLGIATMVWAAYPASASVLGVRHIDSPAYPWLGPFAFALGVGVTAWGWREAGRRSRTDARRGEGTTDPPRGPSPPR